MRIVFMGTPDFAVPVLKAAADTGAEIIGVYTQPDRPVGRKQILTPSPVKVYALEQGFPVFQPERIKRKAEVEALEALQPDLILVAAYGQILSQRILDIPPYGCINMHASLLPKFRGAAPIQRAIVAGETVTGITAMQMDAGMDTGAMIRKVEVEITPEDTAETLHDKLAEAAGSLTTCVLKMLEAGETLPLVPQNDDEATYAPMLRREDGLIDWNRTAKGILDQIRGFYPWPGTYTFWNGQKLSIVEAEGTQRTSENICPGKVHVEQNCMYIETADAMIRVLRLQLQGKKCMEAKAFLLGNHPDQQILGA